MRTFFASAEVGIFAMIFVIEILEEPDHGGNARVIERRTHTGATVTEALRTAQANLRSPPPRAYSYSMRSNGKEVGRWQIGNGSPKNGGQKADVLRDIEAARMSSSFDDDE
jgi:hypothetical protein